MRFLLFLALLVGMGVAERGWAQGVDQAQQSQIAAINRQSLSGAAAVAPSPSQLNEPYNLSLGPVTLRADGSITATYSDNINVAKTGREIDFIVGTGVDLHLLWQPTSANTLNLDLGIGYQFYLDHPRYDGLTLSSSTASQLQYNIYVGDVRINLHDVFSYMQDPLAVGQLSNTAQFGRFQNTAGLEADWNLNGDIILSATYGHTNLWVFQQAYEYLDNQSDSISPQVTVVINPTLSTGFNLSFSDTRYNQDIQNDSTTVTAGPFVTSQLSTNISVQGAGGASLTNYNTGGLNGDTSNKNYTYYANMGVTHRINDVLTESLTAGREVIPGLTSNYTDRIYATYGDSWQATSAINLGTSLWWENLQDSDAIFRQTANRFGAGLSCNYSLNDHASLSLGYQYVLKIANPSGLGYAQDQVTLGFHYNF